MAFFKDNTLKDNTQSVAKRLLWVQRLVWILIYGGLLTFILGHFVAETDVALARTLGVAGMIAFAIGVVLIYVRSRMPDND